MPPDPRSPAPPVAGDPFAPTQLFAFPLFTSVLAGFEEHREPLMDEILAMREEHPGVQRSNRNAWHSGDEFLARPNPHVAWVLNKAIRFGQLTLGRYYRNWATSELVLASCWANVLGAGGWNAPHHHSPCAWSGVYYVSVGTIGQTREDPGGMIEFVNPSPGLSLVGQSGNSAHAPKDGLTFLFPANLQHFVHPRFTDELRVSIAYNFNVTPKRV